MYKDFLAFYITYRLILFPSTRECRNHSPIVKNSSIAIHVNHRPDLSFLYLHCKFFMNLPVGSILATSLLTDSLLPIGKVDSSTFPRLVSCFYRSLCRHVPEKEAARSGFVAPACSCLVSVRDRRVCWYRYR